MAKITVLQIPDDKLRERLFKFKLKDFAPDNIRKTICKIMGWKELKETHEKELLEKLVDCYKIRDVGVYINPPQGYIWLRPGRDNPKFSLFIIKDKF